MKYLFSLIFLIILFLPIFNSLTHVFKFERASENRTFCDSLNIDINSLDKFPKECENYLNDNFEFRSPLIAAYHKTKLDVFLTSPHPENVAIGYNGWHFITQKEQQIYAGKLNFTPTELRKYKKEWHRRVKYLDQKGIECLWVICPFAQYVYDDQMPYNLRKTRSKRRIDVLKNSMKQDFPNLIFDPLQSLIDARENGEKVYYKNDNHWNLKAGEAVSKKIIKEIRKRFPSKDVPYENNYTWVKSIKKGGIFQEFIGLNELFENDENPVFGNEQAPKTANYGFPVLEDFPYPDQYEMRFVHKNPKNKIRVLIIRDSFGDQLMPFLKESFAETVLIFDSWQYKLNEEIIEQYKPDLVIFLGLETHIQNFIE